MFAVAAAEAHAIEPGGIPRHAFTNAERVIDFERIVGLYHEETLQELFLPYRFFIQFWNTYYGTAHFIITIVVFALLFWKRPAVFPVWRNSLAIMTALAIVGFALFLYAFWSWLIHDTVEGWTSLIMVVVILGSANMLVLGVIGEYLGRLYMDSKQRPLFLIDRIVRGSDKSGR